MVGGVVSGRFASPENLLEIMPFMMVHGTRGVQEGQGLSKPPDLTCQALDFVISSSGFETVVVDVAMVAA